MTLRYSRRSFRRVVWKSSQETWARLHEEAWRYFGGACRNAPRNARHKGIASGFIPRLEDVRAALQIRSFL